MITAVLAVRFALLILALCWLQRMSPLQSSSAAFGERSASGALLLLIAGFLGLSSLVVGRAAELLR